MEEIATRHGIREGFGVYLVDIVAGAPAEKAGLRKGDIVVAGRNFGINSSREQAVRVLHLLGVAAVVAPAFGRQFFRNAINNGLPLVEADIAGIEDGDLVEIDLAAGRLRVPQTSNPSQPL